MEKVGESLKIPKISDIFCQGVGNIKNSKFQRIANNLKWRQQFQHADLYELTIGADEMKINFHQIDNGEMRGIGTGAVVWPAAHVLVKYLEKRFGRQGMRGSRVIDIGSGTGFAGIAAAALGGDVVLTDQLCVKDLILSNIEEYNSHSAQIDSEGTVTFAEYNWDEPAESLNPPFDIVLVSDCVLPKLYPIEPLVKAIDAVMDSNSIALFSYEHRVYPFFDPRHEFQRIAFQYQMAVRVIPLSEHDSYYSCEDVEIWEVTRVTSTAVGNQILSWPMIDRRGGISLQNWGDGEEVILAHCSLPHTVPQEASLLRIHQQGKKQLQEVSDQGGGGIIGSYIWASSVVVSRFLLRYPSYELLRSLLPIPSTETLPNNETVVFDIGAGCGLTSLVLSLCGYSVIATDKPDILPLLRKNTTESIAGQICVKSFDWKDSNSNEIVSNVFDRSPDLILLSDCFYRSDAVPQLWKLILKISTQRTILVIANELRSSLDDFLQCLRSPSRCGEGHDLSTAEDHLSSSSLPSWDIKEIELFDSDLEIFRGTGGYLAVRPVKIFLCIQSPVHVHPPPPL